MIKRISPNDLIALTYASLPLDLDSMCI